MKIEALAQRVIDATQQAGRETLEAQWIGGDMSAAGDGEPFYLENPAACQQYGVYTQASAQTVADAVCAGLKAQKAWSGHTAAERAAILWRCAELVREHAQTLARLEAATAGKPIAGTRLEVAAVADMFMYYAGWCDRLYGSVIPVTSGHFNYTLREPLGVVAQITPWNAPIFTCGWQVAAAMAAGNGVVLKPSEHTPFTSVAVAMLVAEAGAPAGLMNVVSGTGATTGEALISHPHIAKVVFVGSRGAGQHVAATAARQGTPSLLELGGKSAHVVFPDADLDACAQGVVNGFMGAAGQSCTAGSRLIAHRKIYQPLLEAIQAESEQWNLGDPLDEATRIGPMITRAQHAKVCEAISAAQQRKVRELPLNVPCKVALDSGYYIRPRVFCDVSPRDPLIREEIFGPVLAAAAFNDEAEAVRLANGTDFDLGAFIWSQNITRAHRVAAHLRAGSVWINTGKVINVRSPFGGMGGSGFGRSSGPESVLAEYTQVKSVWVGQG